MSFPIDNRRKFSATLIALLAASALAFAIMRIQAPVRGVRPIVWDHESCAHCSMTISDHRFACQLQTREGEVYDFDDPGCLLKYRIEKHPHVAAIYFHALEGEHWIEASEAGFVTARNTPMGFGLGAVRAGTPGAISLEDAARVVQAGGGIARATDSRGEVAR